MYYNIIFLNLFFLVNDLKITYLIITLVFINYDVEMFREL
jgi:hypothetical protein